MRPIVTDRVAWSVGLSVSLSVCHNSELPLSPAKTAKAIKIPLGFRTRVGPRNHVLDEGPRSRSPMEGAILRGKANHCKVYGHSAVICAKTAEPIEAPFGWWARMGPNNHALDGCPDLPWQGAISGVGAPTVKYRDFLPRKTG